MVMHRFAICAAFAVSMTSACSRTFVELEFRDPVAALRSPVRMEARSVVPDGAAADDLRLTLSSRDRRGLVTVQPSMAALLSSTSLLGLSDASPRAFIFIEVGEPARGGRRPMILSPLNVSFGAEPSASAVVLTSKDSVPIRGLGKSLPLVMYWAYRERPEGPITRDSIVASASIVHRDYRLLGPLGVGLILGIFGLWAR